MSRPNPPGLPLATVRAQLNTLAEPMPPKSAQRLTKLLDLPGWDADRGCICVADVLPLFGTDAPEKANRKPHEAANKALARLVIDINDAAAAKQLRLRLRLSTQRQGGPEARYLWFEGGQEPPAQRTDELNSLPPDRVVPDVRGIAGGADLAAPGDPHTQEKKIQNQEPPSFKYEVLEALQASRQYIRDLRGAEGAFDWRPNRAVAAPTPAAPKTVVALDYLVDWVEDRAAPPLFALLGEYGMGKTITCQVLKRYLDVRRQAKPADWPRVLYFDLRLVTGLGLNRPVPTLQQVCEDCTRLGWLGDAASGRYQLDDVLTWAQDGALIIFDGLDEVLVHLTAADGQVFTRALLGLPALVRDRTHGQGPQPRLLISCRTHYFRTLADQQTHFTGQQRTGPVPETYRALVLLPLTDEQVATYLKSAFPRQDTGRLLETIAAVHNLSELSRRPYTLGMLADQLPEIEAARAVGQPVYGVRLYRGLAQQWLHRDEGKHQIRKDHKPRLAAHLAALLWREGSGLLPIGRLEDWLHGWLADAPELRARYAGMHPDQLEEDLRTASFLVRDDAGGGGFRFAHTSLLEYFLAEYLLAALRADRPADWLMPTPSPETLDFFGQLLAEAADSGLLARMTGWGAMWAGASGAAAVGGAGADDGLRYAQPILRDGATTAAGGTGLGPMLLAYAVRALYQGWPVPSLRGLVLVGANLSDWRISAPGSGPGLDLTDADLTGCTLRRVRFKRVRLTGAVFRDATLTQATLIDCDATGSDCSGAACDGTIWRRTRLTRARWDGTRGQGVEYLHCVDPPRDVTGMIARIAPCGDRGPRLMADGPEIRPGARPPLELLTGHDGQVNACAFSPDGARLLSAGEDGTLRLWIAATGQGLLTYRGHDRGIIDCAFSSDGARLLSAGWDGTLRLWDAATGQGLLTCRGHEGPVFACACSPDGARLLSAGGRDGTLRVWDAASGHALLTFRSHEGGIGACAFSPDGERLLSVGGGALHLWDAATGQGLLTWRGHEGWVRACAFSPDGARLLSAGEDRTLRLWDAATGQGLLTCRGHEGWVKDCAFSPDGARLLSAGEDWTLRLWSAATGQGLLNRRAHGGPVHACAFSPDGAWLLSAGDDQTLSLWDAASGQRHLTCCGHSDWVTACAFSPDGARLLSGSLDGTLRLWDAATGRGLLTCRGHERGVIDCGFSPDGKRLLSAGDDGILRLWDAGTGQELLTCRGHERRVGACAFSPDGGRLLSASLDGTLRLWDAQTGALLRIHANWRTQGFAGQADHGHAVWDPPTNQVRHAGGDAWRWLRWVATDADGWPDPLPLETFGPIPGL